MSKKLKEQIDYGDYPERMDPNTERKLGDPERNLYGTNPAMPQGTLDVQRLASDRFKKVVDKLRQAMHQPNLSSRLVQGMIMQDFVRSTMEAKRIENNFTEELEELAIQSSLKVTETPEGRYNINAKLIGQRISDLDPEKFQFKPAPKPQFGNRPGAEGNEGGEEGNEERFDANVLTKDERFELEVHKRNIINGIIQGSAKKGHYVFQNPEVKAKLDEMDPNLYGHYLKLMSINDYFYFMMEDLMDAASEAGSGIGGREDLTGNEPRNDGGGDDEEGGEGEEGGQGEEAGGNREVSEYNISAQAVLFPILCHEVVKGIEEALGKFGYSNEPDVASAVIGQTDTLGNEAMSLKIGPELVDRIRICLPDDMFEEENYGIKPFFYKILYEIPAIPFLSLIGNVVSKDERDQASAKNIFREIFDQAKYMRQRYEAKRAEPQNEPEPEPKPRQAAPDLGEPKKEKKDLAGMGINALNFEMNKAIDNGNWELAQEIQKMIERKEGNQR